MKLVVVMKMIVNKVMELLVMFLKVGLVQKLKMKVQNMKEMFQNIMREKMQGMFVF